VHLPGRFGVWMECGECAAEGAGEVRVLLEVAEGRMGERNARSRSFNISASEKHSMRSSRQGPCHSRSGTQLSFNPFHRI